MLLNRAASLYIDAALDYFCPNDLRHVIVAENEKQQNAKGNTHKYTAQQK